MLHLCEDCRQVFKSPPIAFDATTPVSIDDLQLKISLSCPHCNGKVLARYGQLISLDSDTYYWFITENRFAEDTRRGLQVLTSLALSHALPIEQYVARARLISAEAAGIARYVSRNDEAGFRKELELLFAALSLYNENFGHKRHTAIPQPPPAPLRQPSAKPASAKAGSGTNKTPRKKQRK